MQGPRASRQFQQLDGADFLGPEVRREGSSVVVMGTEGMGELDTLSYRVSHLEAELAAAEKDIAALREATQNGLNNLRDESARRERNQLIAGIVFLGGIITTLGSVLWSYRNVIFQNTGP